MKVFFVNDRLAFGGAVKTWRQVEKLGALGITHIVNLRWSQNNAKVRQFPHIWLRFHDDKKTRPAWFYRRALKFCQRAMCKPDSKLFVMCHHGLCRSPSLAYFILRASGANPQGAALRVAGARRSARIVSNYRDSIERFLSGISVPVLASALSISEPYATDIRKGKRLQHPRHWRALARLTAVSPGVANVRKSAPIVLDSGR
jgi:hypothetical protein